MKLSRTARQVLLGAITLMLTISVSAFAACPPPTWTQFAENDDWGTGTRISVSYAYQSVSGVCDNDSDVDWVFVFKGNFYNCDPDKIRYDNGGWINNSHFKISRLVLSDDDVHLCMGQDTLNLFYGGNIQNIFNGFRLYKLP